MPLCHTCQSLPIRKILRFLDRDESVRNDFLWFHTPWSGIEDDRFKRPFVRWHDSIINLQTGAKDCSFCGAIFAHLRDSYHYKTNIKEGEVRGLLLEVPILGSNPQFTLYIGDTEPEARISGHYWFGTTPDSPVAHIFQEHIVIEESLHPFVLKHMENWLASCDAKHPKCHSARDLKMSLPSRLLDLSALPERKDLLKFQGDPRSVFAGKSCKLVENGLTSTGQYVALSYCWGKSLAYTTTTTNLVAHKQEQGIKYDNLPKTLQDALFLVRYLGLQYLWADCVCIVQDDKADWEHEAARMADVYSNAYLTIAATRASHCGEGFLQPRKIKSRQSTPFEDEDGSFELYFDYDDCTTSPGSMQTVTYQPLRLHKGEPLLERVWCFQERVLATRTLHFASDKMYWECAQCFETEEGIVNDHEEDFYKEYSMEKIASGLKNAAESEDPNASRDAWFRLIQEYTSRNMTYQSDKLPALSGIISALQIITGDICYAGIWRSWFMKGLLWRLQVPEWDMYVFTPKQPSQVGFYRAPSWSFASIEGVVLYNEVDRVDAWNFCAQLEDCSVTSKGNNPLGELESGFARITGPVTSIVSVAQGVTQNGRTGMVCLRDQRLVAAAVYFDFDRYDSCQVLMITPHTGIAISPVGEDKDTFVRVGAVSVYPLWDDIELFRASEKPDRFLTPSAFPQPRSITII